MEWRWAPEPLPPNPARLHNSTMNCSNVFSYGISPPRPLHSASLKRDGVALAAAAAGGRSWSLARYNDPSTPPPFRRNEVLMQLDDNFDIWKL